MAEKMTAVWLIILTIIVCASVPAVMILLTSHPKTQMILGLGTNQVLDPLSFDRILFNLHNTISLDGIV